MKLQAIKILGGKCSICGYSKCIDALEFHHRVPAQKEFRLGAGNTISWREYKKELSTMEDKLSAMEDRYYKQFTAMEKALSQLNSQSSSLTSLFGGGSM